MLPNIAELISRIDDATRCFEAAAKSSAELAGRWQQDIAYRDSLRHAHSLSRLKRLYSPAE